MSALDCCRLCGAPVRDFERDGYEREDGQRGHFTCDAEVAPRPCNATRPETLGYQQCWKAPGHVGMHKSQDSKEWL